MCAHGGARGPAHVRAYARACTLSILSILSKKKKNMGLAAATMATMARQNELRRGNGLASA